MGRAYRIFGLTAALGILIFVLGGCGGGYSPTLPSPDRTPGTLVTGFPLTGSGGAPITGAKLNQFTVVEKATGAPDSEYRSAKPTKLVEETTQQSGQYNVVLVLDRSGSMSGTMDLLKVAANEFVDDMRANDMVEVVDYDDMITVTQAFTTDKALLHTAINSLYARDLTATWDAAMKALQDLNALSRTGRKAIMLMTDGDDNSSSNDADDVIALANANNIQVFCLGIGSGANMTEMMRVASQTGALAWSAYDAAGISAAFAEFQEAVVGGYQFYWRTTFDPGDTIDVKITYNGPGGPIEIMRTNVAVPLEEP
jgi:VWFA-related protein